MLGQLPLRESMKLANPSVNFSTTIRVLLAKAQNPRGTALKIDKGNLFYSPDDRAPWKRVGPDALLQVIQRRGRNSIGVNSEDSQSPVIFFRGGTNSGPLAFLGRWYRGAIRVHIEEDTLNLVNLLPLEQYLVGVIDAEMGESWPLEALKAQSVAARSYAMFRLSQPKNPWYDIESTVQDQVYHGVRLSSIPAKSQKAVAATQGQVLTESGKVCRALFHARCGGQTETAQSVWNRGSGATGDESVLCPGCQKRRFDWRVQIPVTQILRRLKFPDEDHDLTIRNVKRASSGRVVDFIVESSQNSRKVTSDEFRSLIGYEKLKSSFFSWRFDNHTMQIDGRGAGHGVGLCQWGARYLANLGKDYLAILRHYYPRLRIEDGPSLSVSNRALSWSERTPSQSVRSLSRSDVLPNRTSFQSVFAAASTRRSRSVSNQ